MRDGAHPLSDENPETRQYGDELACAGLQLETCDEYPGGKTADRGETGIEAGIFFTQIAHSTPTRGF